MYKISVCTILTMNVICLLSYRNARDIVKIYASEQSNESNSKHFNQSTVTNETVDFERVIN